MITIRSIPIIIFIALFGIIGRSQTLTPGIQAVWGGETIEYTRGTIDNCHVTWTVTHGVFPDHGNATSIDQLPNNTKAKVKWNNASWSDGSIKFTRYNCNNNTNNGSITYSGFRILSIKNLNLAPIQGSASVPYCSNSPVTYSIPKLVIPHSAPANNPTALKYASGYEWTIPNGWTGPNGQTGTFRIDNPNANSITLTPGPCTGGSTLRVRAYTDTEGRGEPHYSNFSPTFSITRTLPEITTSTSTFQCNVPFTAQIAPLSCATGYNWTVPAGWQIQGSGNSVTITPTTAAGNITVTPILSGTGCAPVTKSRVITPTNPISISGPNDGACASLYSVPNVPTGATVTWTFSSNLQRVNPAGNLALMVVPVNPQFSGGGWVQANVSVPGGCSYVDRKDIWVGVPSHPDPAYQSFNIYGGGTFSAPSFQGVITGYNWTVSSSLTIVNGGGTSNNTITVSLNSGQTSGDIFVRARNSCGASLQQAQIRVNRAQGFNFMVYPNPVAEDLHVEVIGNDSLDLKEKTIDYQIQLFDENGNEFVSKKAKGQKDKISVRNLKDGIYYVHILYKEGIIRKKIVIRK